MSPEERNPASGWPDIMGASLPRYWFTTHYPRLPDGRDTLHIYLQEKHRKAGDGIAIGDRVFVYKPAYLFHGFNGGSGIKELDLPTYREMLAAFSANDR